MKRLVLVVCVVMIIFMFVGCEGLDPKTKVDKLIEEGNALVLQSKYEDAFAKYYEAYTKAQKVYAGNRGDWVFTPEVAKRYMEILREKMRAIVKYFYYKSKEYALEGNYEEAHEYYNKALYYATLIGESIGEFPIQAKSIKKDIVKIKKSKMNETVKKYIELVEQGKINEALKLIKE